MRHTQRNRATDAAGITILELLVGIAILAVLIGLLIPAIQRARASAVRSQNFNNLRQISLATQQYASSTEGYLPYFIERGDAGRLSGSSPLSTVLRYISAYQEYEIDHDKHYRYVSAVFQNPADPSYAELPTRSGDCSYSANAQVFRPRSKIHSICSDGTSSTVGWGEQYARCGAATFHSNSAYPCEVFRIESGPMAGQPFYIPSRRHSFADPECNDVYPQHFNGSSGPVRTYYGISVQTFQVLPRATDCDPSALTASHSSGLAVSMMDGSVRGLARGIHTPIFWAMITPNGGEVVSEDY